MPEMIQTTVPDEANGIVATGVLLARFRNDMVNSGMPDEVADNILIRFAPEWVNNAGELLVNRPVSE